MFPVPCECLNLRLMNAETDFDWLANHLESLINDRHDPTVAMHIVLGVLIQSTQME